MRICLWLCASRNVHAPQEDKWSKERALGLVSGDIPSASDTSLLYKSVTQAGKSNESHSEMMCGGDTRGQKEVSFNNGQGHLLIRVASVE